MMVLAEAEGKEGRYVDQSGSVDVVDRVAWKISRPWKVIVE